MYMSEPSSFCENPRTVVGPPAYNLSCGGINPGADATLRPNTLPPRIRNARTFEPPMLMYLDASPTNLLNCKSLFEKMTGEEFRASRRMIEPRVGDSKLFELSRVTARLSTASCWVFCNLSRSAASHWLKTAQNSAGCASVRPRSIE